ncbi:4273_t:CDS:2, partial [Gigaspora rosea]
TEGAIVCKSGYTTEINCEGMECASGDSGGPAFTVDEFTSTVYLVSMVFGGITENGIKYCYVHPVSAILLEGME